MQAIVLELGGSNLRYLQPRNFGIIPAFVVTLLCYRCYYITITPLWLCYPTFWTVSAFASYKHFPFPYLRLRTMLAIKKKFQIAVFFFCAPLSYRYYWKVMEKHTCLLILSHYGRQGNYLGLLLELSVTSTMYLPYSLGKVSCNWWLIRNIWTSHRFLLVVFFFYLFLPSLLEKWYWTLTEALKWRVC